MATDMINTGDTECYDVIHLILIAIISLSTSLLLLPLLRPSPVAPTPAQQQTQNSTESSRKNTKTTEKITERVKMVLIVRTDLEMTKGKAAAQCCHACLAAYESSLDTNRHALIEAWKWNGQPKITLKCGSEEEMLLLEATALSLGLVAESIQDAGRTQVAPGSRTVLALGPDVAGKIDTVSGHLKLF